MNLRVQDNIASLISDIVSLAGGEPATAIAKSTLKFSVNNYLKSKQEKAFQLLIEETKGGIFPQKSPEEVNEIFGMMLRYQRAALEGEKEINLRIMASVFAGVCGNETIYPDKFRSFVGKISDLAFEEIQAIALIYKYKTEIDLKRPSGFTECNAIGLSVLGPYFNDSKFLAHCSSATRTGLLMMQLDQNLYLYTSTPIMDELVSLTRFQEILSDEISSRESTNNGR